MQGRRPACRRRRNPGLVPRDRVLPAGGGPGVRDRRRCERWTSSEVDVHGGRRGVETRPDAELLLDALLDLVREVGVVAQERPRILLALTELVPLVGVPGAGLADDPLLDAHVDEAA